MIMIYATYLTDTLADTCVTVCINLITSIGSRMQSQVNMLNDVRPSSSQTHSFIEVLKT